MNQNKRRDWIYFLVLAVITTLFVVAGIYWTNRGKSGTTTTSTNATQSADSNQSSPENPANNNNLTTDQQLYTQGIKSLDSKDYESAIHYLEQAITINPDNISYYSLKSEAEFLAGKKADAKATLEAGLKVDPSNELLNSKLDVLTKEYFQSPDFEATRE